mgnify:CR=1 FL=1
MIQKLKLTTWTDVDHQYILTHINLEPWLNIENLKIEGKFVLLEIDSISTNFTHYDFYLPILSRGIFMYKKCLHYHDVVKKDWFQFVLNEAIYPRLGNRESGIIYFGGLHLFKQLAFSSCIS